jgi:hypothetical protein
MAPIAEYKCINPRCMRHFEEIVKAPIPEKSVCPECHQDAHKTLSTFGGYAIKGNNSASVRPKRAGSFKRGDK